MTYLAITNVYLSYEVQYKLIGVMIGLSRQQTTKPIVMGAVNCK